MNNVKVIRKVIKVDTDSIIFEGNIILSSHHNQDCCETHYLSMSDLTLADFEGLEFDLSGNNFFKKIEDYGIELIPIKGHSIRIPGYASNNGYYSSNLSLTLYGLGITNREYDIEECQSEID